VEEKRFEAPTLSPIPQYEEWVGGGGCDFMNCINISQQHLLINAVNVKNLCSLQNLRSG
jgi:hypothetical protein